MRRKRNPVFLPFVVVTAFLFAGIFISAATEGRGSNKAQREVQETSTRWQLARQDEAEEICVNLFRKGKKVGNLSSYLRRIEVTDDFFFKGAPLIIVVSSKSNINAGLASAYMEIMANSLGLGVLYSGFFVMCTKLSRKLRNLIELEKGYDVVSCMVIGYPKVKYQRIVPRKDLQVNRL